MTPQDYCAQKCAESGSSFRHAFRLLSPHQRRGLEAVYAYCREVDDLVDDCQDSSVAAAALAWWAEELERVQVGAAQHPVGQALQWAMPSFGLDQNDLWAVLRGMQRDLVPARVQTWAELETYCDEVAGAVGRLAARIFGPCPPAVLAYASQLGLALQLTNICRDVGEDLRMGRVYLPQSLLQTHGLNSEMILQMGQASIRAQHGAAMTAVLQAVIQRAEQAYQSALSLLPREECRRQRAGLMMGSLYRALLRLIAEDPLLVCSHRIRLGGLHRAQVMASALIFGPRWG